MLYQLYNAPFSSGHGQPARDIHGMVGIQGTSTNLKVLLTTLKPGNTSESTVVYRSTEVNDSNSHEARKADQIKLGLDLKQSET